MEYLKEEIKQIKAELQEKEKRIVSLENMLNTILPTLQLCLHSINAQQKTEPLIHLQPSLPKKTYENWEDNPNSGQYKVHTIDDKFLTCLNEKSMKYLNDTGSIMLKHNEYIASISRPPFKRQTNETVYHFQVSVTCPHGKIEFKKLIDVRPLMDKNVSTWLLFEQKNISKLNECLRNQ